MNIKPPVWSLSPSQVSPEWRWFWNYEVLSILIWHPVDSIYGHLEAGPNGTPNTIQSKFGSVMRMTSTGDESYKYPSSTWLPEQEVTVMLIARRHGTNVAHIDFGTNEIGNGLTRMNVALGYANTNVTFDFGGNDGDSRLVATLTDADFTDWNVWVFRAGPKGMFIFRNGIIVGSNGNVSNRTNNDAYSFYFGRGADSGTAIQSAGNYDYALFSVVGTELSDKEVRIWSSDPFGPLRQANRLFLPDLPRSFGSVVVPSDTQRQPITVESSGQTDINISQDSSNPALKITP